jgi:heme exporter protein C
MSDHALAADPPATSTTTSTSSRGTRILAVLTLASMAVLVLLALVLTEPDVELADSVRILYLHVPTVSVAYLFMIGSAVASAFHLWRRSEFADLLAHACAELGLLFLCLTLLTGALWGKATWDTYWTWDPRLTSTALLALLWVGYLAVRAVPAEPRSRGVRSAVVAIAAACLIPIVHFSAQWWKSLHQTETVFGPLDPKIHGLQQFTVMYSFVPFLLLGAWLLVHRFRVAWLVERDEELGLDVALAERRAEAAGERLEVEVTA